ncbi:unnamed protein product, partial [Closterium sp. NIES-53]
NFLFRCSQGRITCGHSSVRGGGAAPIRCGSRGGRGVVGVWPLCSHQPALHCQGRSSPPGQPPQDVPFWRAGKE